MLSGCGSLSVKPQNIASYNNGIAIIQSNQEESKIQFEVAQNFIGGIDNEPLLLYITVQNLSNKDISFDTDSITVQNNNKILHALEFQELQRYNLNLSEALYAYGKEIEIDSETSIEIKVIDTFFKSQFYYPYYPLYFYRGYGYRFYDYSFARASLQAERNAILQRKAKQILIANYLRKNTLTKNDTKGGFVVIPYKKMESGVLLVRVQLGEDTHVLTVNLNDGKNS
ncbi:hypothetical protein LS73_003535 [Helicobacter muridarum]|uniref:Uncharacterized protein n=2 Tax=Helicobacter muridarum TaxID=216 RepID=A0A4U8TM61_9HELI|nr:hypothetical protein LS73_003535 [Helicobacter muridarum]